MLQIDIITALPASVENYFLSGILGRATAAGICSIKVHNLRDWTEDSRKTIDDHPFGGSPGMLLKVEPIYKALIDLGYGHLNERPAGCEVWITDATAKIWNQQQANTYATTLSKLCIICGRYEGIDNRVSEYLVNSRVSIGKFILTGGELVAAAVVDSMVRLLPNALGNAESLSSESFNTDLSDYPQYTRPEKFTANNSEEWKVPSVLLSGNHAEINAWQARQQVNLTDS